MEPIGRLTSLFQTAAHNKNVSQTYEPHCL